MRRKIVSRHRIRSQIKSPPPSYRRSLTGSTRKRYWAIKFPGGYKGR
jgi:hypothetical protein